MCGNCHYPVMVIDTKIKTAKPTDKPFKLYDEDGLFIIVKPNGLRWWHWCHTCCIPDDYIDTKRYPLFVARAVMAELVAQLKASGKGAT